MGYSPSALAEANLAALELYRGVAEAAGMARRDVVISGCIGPKGGAYERSEDLATDGAQQYHQAQVDTFKSGTPTS